MKQNLTNLMNWSNIQEITTSESAHPHDILGRHMIKGIDVLQAYLPGARKVTVTFKGKKPLEMTCIEEKSSWFVVELNASYKGRYFYTIQYDSGKPVTVYDPYSFKPLIAESDLERFKQGIHYELYDMLGAHPTVVDGVKGTQFAVWAPNAMRVSVVGPFNMWDGRRHQMYKHHGVFELFVPGVGAGELYKFEVKTKDRVIQLKADPVAFSAELRPNNASIVADISQFNWTDADWIRNRANTQRIDSPISEKANIQTKHFLYWQISVVQLKR